MDAEIGEQCEKAKEPKGDPVFGFHHGRSRISLKLSPASSAAAISWSAGALPIRRSTIAEAVSAAIDRTLPMAVVRVAVIDCSAAASRS